MSEDLRPPERRLSSDELNQLADAWIRYWYAPEGSTVRNELSGATDLYELEYYNPEDLWKLILLIHGRDQSNRIQEVLSAGPVEDLLVKHGDSFIDRIETQARLDPQFAKLVGGVWKNRMSDANWNRLHAVSDRKGWDGIPN
jgi:hypothetical protein